MANSSRLCPFPLRGEGSTGKIPNRKPMKKDHENGQGDSALQDLFFEAMKLAGAAIALADDYAGGESETAQHLAKEYDKLNIKFDLLKS